MQDTEFFEEVLGLCKPWKVESMKMDLAKRRVDVVLGCKAGTLWAEDGQQLPIHGYEERKWRHLDTMQLETVIYARVPRVSYPDGKTACVRVPWAERHSRLSRMMEAWVIQVLRSATSVSKAAELLHLSWDVVDGVMKRAVERGLLRPMCMTVRPWRLLFKLGGQGCLCR